MLPAILRCLAEIGEGDKNFLFQVDPPACLSFSIQVSEFITLDPVILRPLEQYMHGKKEGGNNHQTRDRHIR